ncbi:hypothetical protein DRO53_00785 [Candidatus Bathyarchaeota archaeon]|nr:MAG: hypothetical protein DRO53_00785 [Candidatus Bathyarchaeota archaeon]
MDVPVPQGGGLASQLTLQGISRQTACFRRRKSPFIRLFREKRPGVLCPSFWLLAWANGCPYHCAYCFLQGTFKGKTDPVIYTNLRKLLWELKRWLKASLKPRMLNTGELSDSLAITDELAKTLIPIFGRQSLHKLLLLTKSNMVEGILDLPHNGQTVVSFSLNAEEVAKLYEPDAPPPRERLRAAWKCLEAGYPVRIRIDPLIPVEGWEDVYAELAEQVAQLNPERVTLGSLRVFPAVKAFSRRNPSVFKYATERTLDGRYRPPEKIRIKMYRFMVSRLKGLEIGLCKETPTVHAVLRLPLKCNCTP